MEGKKEEEGVVPANWVLEESQTLFWPQGVNAEKVLRNRQEPVTKLWRRFLLKKVKLTSGRYFSFNCMLSLQNHRLAFIDLNVTSK